jgi:hypothetical protein
MPLSPQHIQSVISLPGPDRYEYFIKQTADREEVWGLYKDGWALAATNDGNSVFPLWPAEEYADMCAKEEWSGYEASSISLNDFIDDLLPMLERDGVLPGVFYTPADKGITPEVSQLLSDLDHELKKYE